MITLYNQYKNALKNLIVATLILISPSVAAKSEATESIQVPVNELHSSLINLMQSADEITFQERYEMIQPVIIEHFNSPLIAKVVLGRYWKTIDEQSQRNFIDLFNRLTISTYVDRFDSYNDENFSEPSVEKMKKNRYMVKTEYLRKDNDPVSFNYIVQNNDGEWKIISVIANGINDLSLKRADYSAVIKNQGFDALITDLEQKISNLETGI